MPHPRCSRFAGVLCAVFTLWISAALAAPLLPDLTIEGHPRPVETINGKQLLRFTTWGANRGVGPIELRGGAINGNVQDVDQRVYDLGVARVQLPERVEVAVDRVVLAGGAEVADLSAPLERIGVLELGGPDRVVGAGVLPGASRPSFPSR